MGNGYNSIGITVTPEMIEQLLSDGMVSVERGDTQVNLMYETVPKNQSEGWQE